MSQNTNYILSHFCTVEENYVANRPSFRHCRLLHNVFLFMSLMQLQQVL